MARILKVKMLMNEVTATAVFDSDNIPDWVANQGWISAPEGTNVGDVKEIDGSFTPLVIGLSPTQVEELKQIIAAEVIDNRGAIRALALACLDEINLLRVENNWNERTVQQLRDTILNKID